MLAAWHLWSDKLACRSLLFYIDNNAVRDSLISGTSSNLHMQMALEAVFDLQDTSGSVPWYVRVPSKSNPADAPSRDCFDELPAGSRLGESLVRGSVTSCVGALLEDHPFISP